MSFVSGEYGGSKVEAPEKQTRMVDRDIRKLRSTQIYVQKLKGWSSVEIGKFFGISRQYVNREIRCIPPKAKATIEGMYRRGEISVA